MKPTNQTPSPIIVPIVLLLSVGISLLLSLGIFYLLIWASTQITITPKFIGGVLFFAFGVYLLIRVIFDKPTTEQKED